MSATRTDRRNGNNKINDTLRLLGNNFSYDGQERKWIEHRKNLKIYFSLWTSIKMTPSG